MLNKGTMSNLTDRLCCGLAARLIDGDNNLQLWKIRESENVRDCFLSGELRTLKLQLCDTVAE